MRVPLIISIYFLVLFLQGFSTNPTSAIELSDLKFKEVGKPEGLSDSSVLDIVEDEKGYIWIATVNGLNKYSGYNVKQYHPSDTNPNSIPSGYIYKLLFDSQQNLWAATHSGLARYRPESDDFEVFNTSNSVLKADIITGISESSDGDVLFTDFKHLYKFSILNQRVELVKKVHDKPSIIGVIRDETHRIWLGSKKLGISLLDKQTNELYRMNEVNPWGISLDINAVNELQVINGNYWFATNNGIKVVSASGQLIKHISDEVFNTVSKQQVKTIKEIGHNVWVGTGHGVFILKNVLNADINTIGKIDYIHLDQASQEITLLPLADISHIYIDRIGVVWLGSLKRGTYKYHPVYAKSKYKPVFNSGQNVENDHSAIWGFAEDKSGQIYLASQQRGIGLIQDDTSDVLFFDIFGQLPASTTYWDLEIDKDGTFWLASSNGLYLLQLNDDKLQIVEHIFEGSFIDFLYYRDNGVWLYTEQHGTVELSYDGNTVAVSPLKNTRPSDRLIPIFKDSSDRLWLRGDKGLNVFDLNNQRIIKSFSSDNGIDSIAYGVYETSDAFWVTTRSNGISMINKSTLEVLKSQKRPEGSSHITSSIGVKDNVLYVDSSGVHQLSLPKLTEVSLIPNSELNYNSLGESSVFSSTNGYVYFGGMEGYNRITVDHLGITHSTSTTLSPEIEEFRVFGEQNSLSQSDELFQNRGNLIKGVQNNTIDKEKINLSYDESRFSVSFYLLNALYPSQTIYRYRLLGFDESWTHTSVERTAQFNNIKFGSYTFEVQAKEPQKSWSTSKRLKIDVARPPWLHTVALVFYFIIVVAFLGFIIRQYQIRKASQLAIKESEERLKLTLWSSGDELWDWDVYRGQVYRANTWGTLDFPQDDIRTTGAYDANIHPNDIARVKDSLREHLEGKSDFYELAYRAKTFSNQWIWILDRGKVVERDHNEQPVRMTGTLKNIHHLKEAEEQLNLFKRSIENISEGVFITNTHFKFISVNNAYCGYTGETRDQALASYMHFNLYPDAFTEEIKKSLKSKSNWSGEVESVRVNGERYEMELNIDAVHDEDGKISHFVGVFSDITSRKNTEKELLKLANTDPLTELPNRSFFQASHQILVQKGAQHTLLCLDMDNFKKINDSLGHQTGDILIKQIAKRLQRTTGKSATCYRLGGDEFSVLMDDNADVHTVTHYAQNLLDTLSRPFIINKQEFVLGASIGIAFYPDDGNSPQEMLKNADTAMYFAKNNGGNSYQFFSGEMNQNAVRQLQIENLIRQGIKEDLFTVYYQPKVDIATGKLVSMEALVRFEHPRKGIVSPGQFIPLAEQTGQIIDIGEQVLRKACADTKRWVSKGLFSGRVAVNISAKQFELPDLDDRINRILNDVGLSPLHLECEITEGTLMESPENGLQMMTRLRERGIHLALDDFGTGYSSLAYLKRFPLNTLKIDKAFIDDIAISSVDRHMAAAIINIAHNLGLKVVAEGVEEETQLDILRRYDCEMLQGFLYSRPLNAERFEKLLTENQQLHNIFSQSSA